MEDGTGARCNGRGGKKIMTVRMEAFCCSETSGTFYPSTRRRMPEELNFDEQNCRKIESRKQCVSLVTL